MRHLLFWIIVVPVVIVLVTFAVMNRQEINLDLWPLPWATPPVPVFALLFGGLLVGFGGGVFVMWRHGAAGRRRNRDLSRQVNIQTSELDKLRRSAPAVPATAVVERNANVLVPPAI
jgi:uncharacterized integral membrane protein